MTREEMLACCEEMMARAKALQSEIADLPAGDPRRQQVMADLQKLHTERLDLQHKLSPRDFDDEE